jgi:hypothetical protein
MVTRSPLTRVTVCGPLAGEAPASRTGVGLATAAAVAEVAVADVAGRPDTTTRATLPTAVLRQLTG